MRWRMWIRLLFGLLVAIALFLALTPGPIGQIVPSEIGRHTLAFALLPIIAHLGWPQCDLTRLGALFVVAGGTIELMQGWMALGRGAQWHDWLVDVAAIALAVVVIIIGQSALNAYRDKTQCD